MVESWSLILGNLITESSKANLNKVLCNDFSNEITKILGTPKDDSSFDDKITITYNKYHTGILEYLVYSN